jgi:hypothetical protein
MMRERIDLQLQLERAEKVIERLESEILGWKAERFKVLKEIERIENKEELK